MDDYIVIKLTGGWIEKEQAKGRINFLLENVSNAKVVKNAVLRMSASQSMSKFELAVGDEEFVTKCLKKGIVNRLAKELMVHRAVDFSTSESDNLVKLTGNLAVICEKRLEATEKSDELSLENVVDLDKQTAENNAAMRKVMDFMKGE